MTKLSAGVLLWRRRAQGVETLLVHPGGPFWATKDEGAWSLPKGELHAGEDAEAAARREFAEETGFTLTRPLAALGAFRLPSGKRFFVFLSEGDADPAQLSSNDCEIEWPPKSGRRLQIPEVDRAQWFCLSDARRKIAIGQRPILEAAVSRLVDKAPAP